LPFWAFALLASACAGPDVFAFFTERQNNAQASRPGISYV
jgi:hypothetical protein